MPMLQNLMGDQLCCHDSCCHYPDHNCSAHFFLNLENLQDLFYCLSIDHLIVWFLLHIVASVIRSHDRTWKLYQELFLVFINKSIWYRITLKNLKHIYNLWWALDLKSRYWNQLHNVAKLHINILDSHSIATTSKVFIKNSKNEMAPSISSKLREI